MAGWLHTEINVRHQELNPDTVAHLSTNRARRRLLSLIEANGLTTTPDRQPLHRLLFSFDITIATSNISNFTVSSDFLQLMKSVQKVEHHCSTVPTDAKYSLNRSALALSSVTGVR